MTSHYAATANKPMRSRARGCMDTVAVGDGKFVENRVQMDILGLM